MEVEVSFMKQFFKYISNLVKKSKCNHTWKPSGFSYVRCIECNEGEYNPGLCSHLRNHVIMRNINNGNWKEEDVIKKLGNNRL